MGEMRIWTRVGGIENKGEKSEVQSDLQIPSSLSSHQPLPPVPPALSFSLILVQFQQPYFHFSENHMEKYIYKVQHIHVHICVFIRYRGLHATKRRFSFIANLEGARPLYTYRQHPIQINPLLTLLSHVEDNFFFIPKTLSTATIRVQPRLLLIITADLRCKLISFQISMILNFAVDS